MGKARSWSEQFRSSTGAYSPAGLQYTRILVRLLAELGEEADEVNCKDVALALRAVEALTQKGLERAALAHVGLVWERAPSTAQHF